jgi:hypothetical protein
MKVLNYRRTCYACPSQWEGQLDNGLFFYVRYRWGYFSIGLGTTVDEAVGDDFYDSETGEALDGFMADSEMAFKMAEAGFDMTDAKLDGEPCEEFNL